MQELKRIYSSEVDDLKTFIPDGAFAIELLLSIGPKEEIWADDFSMTLCNPKGYCAILEQDFQEDEKIFSVKSMNILVIRKYDYTELISYLTNLIKSISRKYPNSDRFNFEMHNFSYWEFYPLKVSELCNVQNKKGKNA